MPARRLRPSRYGLLLLMSVVLVGCGPGASAPQTAPPTQASVPRYEPNTDPATAEWLSISTSPDVIADAERRAAPVRGKEFQDRLQRIARDGPGSMSRSDMAPPGRGKEVVAYLKERLKDPLAPEMAPI